MEPVVPGIHLQKQIFQEVNFLLTKFSDHVAKPYAVFCPLRLTGCLVDCPDEVRVRVSRDIESGQECPGTVFRCRYLQDGFQTVKTNKGFATAGHQVFQDNRFVPLLKRFRLESIFQFPLDGFVRKIYQLDERVAFAAGRIRYEDFQLTDVGNGKRREDKVAAVLVEIHPFFKNILDSRGEFPAF